MPTIHNNVTKNSLVIKGAFIMMRSCIIRKTYKERAAVWRRDEGSIREATSMARIKCQRRGDQLEGT